MRLGRLGRDDLGGRSREVPAGAELSDGLGGLGRTPGDLREGVRAAEGGRSAQGDTHIPVIEEELQVGKREEQQRGVRIYSRKS